MSSRPSRDRASEGSEGFRNDHRRVECRRAALVIPDSSPGRHPHVVISAILGTKAADPAERRQITVLFCDLVGSTALSEELDPEDLRDVIRRYHATCELVVARYNGSVAQHLGDGVLVYFGHPRAHEDDAVRAVRAGLELRDAVSGLTVGGRALAVRVSIHTGVVVVGSVGATGQQLALGATPNLAARIQQEAPPPGPCSSARLPTAWCRGSFGKAISASTACAGSASPFACIASKATPAPGAEWRRR